MEKDESIFFEKWLLDKNTDPDTGRKIQINSNNWNRLNKRFFSICQKYNFPNYIDLGDAWLSALKMVNSNKIVFPLEGNKPFIEKWSETKLEQSKIYLLDPKYFKTNWGLLTGKINDIIIIETGENTLKDMLKESTFTVETSSGRIQYYFKWEDKYLNFDKDNTLNNLGIKIISNNDYALLPGSVE